MTQPPPNSLAALSDSTDKRTPLSSTQRTLCFFILIVAIFPLWYKLGSHPLYPRSEGRYASISQDMLVKGHWLIPRLKGEIHLTKPPLIYWAQAGCMALLGQNEWACRLPSALAGSLVLVIIFVLGWQLYDIRLGALASGVLGMMPLFVVVSRLTLTDSLLNLFWFAAIAAGFLAILEPPGKRRNIFVVALWLAVAFGWMTKGPLALVPVGVLWIWLALAGRWRDIKKIKPVAGLIFSLIPIAIWVGLVAFLDSYVWQLWYTQIVGRAINQGAHLHAKPIWYFIPVFLGGMFPATCMLYLPGANYSFKRIWPLLRSGGDWVYWGLQIILPFIMFTLITGKLATYILPLCAPLALLTGYMLLQWLDGKHDNPKEPAQKNVKPPEVVGTFFVSLFITIIIFTTLLVYALGLGSFLLLAPVVALIIAAGWLWNIWKKKPNWRAVGLAAVFLIYVLNIAFAWNMEQYVLTLGSTKTIVKKVERQIDFKPKIITYGYDDKTLDFYYDNWGRAKNSATLKKDSLKLGNKLVVIASSSHWQQLKKTDPKLAAKFTLLFKWRRGFLTKDRLVLEGK